MPLTKGKSEIDGGVKRNSFTVFLDSTQGGADTTHSPRRTTFCTTSENT